jgi:hypothetical protein
MTASVITDGITRIPLVPGSNANVSGDKIAVLPLVYRAPGQLWERVAEASERKFRYVWRGGMPRGPRFTVSDMSGIIRAGRVVR